jgi:hypothetical protein
MFKTRNLQNIRKLLLDKDILKLIKQREIEIY